MNCKKCGHELKRGTKFCPNCGAATESTKNRGVFSIGGRVLFLTVAVILVAGLSVGSFRIVRIILKDDPRENWVATVKENGKWYIINGNNEKLEEIEIENILDVGDFNEYGIAKVELGQTDMTYINTEGDILVTPFKAFSDDNDFANRPLESRGNWSCERGIFEENGKKGFIDTTGKVIVSPEFDEVYGFGENGLAAVKAEGKWGFVDREGEMVIEPSYILAESFCDNGLAWVVTQNGDQCFINSDGEIVIETGFNIFHSNYNVFSFDQYGFAEVELDGKWTVMNESGVMLTDPVFESVNVCDENNIVICLGGEYGVMDTQGAMTIAPVYDFLMYLGEGYYYYSVSEVGKCGIIDQNGDIIVEPIYDHIALFGEKWIVYFDDDREVHILDRGGEIEEEWENMGEELWHTYIYNRELGDEELFGVKIDGEWRFFDGENKTRFKTREDFARIYPEINFSNSPIGVGNNDKWGYINTDGKLMIDFQYEEINKFFDKSTL